MRGARSPQLDAFDSNAVLRSRKRTLKGRRCSGCDFEIGFCDALSIEFASAALFLLPAADSLADSCGQGPIGLWRVVRNVDRGMAFHVFQTVTQVDHLQYARSDTSPHGVDDLPNVAVAHSTPRGRRYEGILLIQEGDGLVEYKQLKPIFDGEGV